MRANSLKSKIVERLNELGVDAKRSLGQNFLINENVIERIIDRVSSVNAEVIVEIGPGPGSLTDQLIALKKNLYVIELDRDWAKYWSDNGLNVTEHDAAQLNWDDFLNQNEIKGRKVCVVGNLPYQISSRLMVEFCLTALQAEDFIFMFQKEVADRMTAKTDTDDYGLLTVMVQSFFTVESVVRASQGDFFPAPKVQSKVLRFKRKAETDFKDRQERTKFLKFLKVLFKMRRKTVLNNLKELTMDPKSLLDHLQISAQLRPEQLDIAQITRIFKEREVRLGNQNS
jgi:16S rRNA (adenine1518-N6/adenine1519-N6)-dimethyltransferase